MMKTLNTNSVVVMRNIETQLGLGPETLERLGALIVLWSLFEGTLEIALWALRGENPSGRRPSTDGPPVSQWISDLRVESQDRKPGVAPIVRLMCDAAGDLLAYRNAIVHGWPMRRGVGGGFLSNPRWHGELRKRASGEAHVDAHLLNIAIQIAQTLVVAVSRLRSTLQDPRGFPETRLEDLVPSLREARLSASELRHLSDSVNHEKY